MNEETDQGHTEVEILHNDYIDNGNDENVDNYLLEREVNEENNYITNTDTIKDFEVYEDDASLSTIGDDLEEINRDMNKLDR